MTFTAETWQHIDREMDEKFPGRKIVGWYHTHPGFGIFLSEMDLFIQRHFFKPPGRRRFVYDPQSKERGLFGWSGGEIVRQTFRGGQRDRPGRHRVGRAQPVAQGARAWTTARPAARRARPPN